MFAYKILLLSASFSLTVCWTNSCCPRLELDSTTLTLSGSLERRGVWADRPLYWNRQHNLFLYYLPMRVGGLWMLGPHIGKIGLVGQLGDAPCPEDTSDGSWQYRVGSSWLLNQHVKLTCSDVYKEPRKIDIQEIKGGFTLENMNFLEKIEMPNTNNIKNLSYEIEESLEDMLSHEREISDQVEFKVTVENILVGDAEIDFKIQYNIKDSFNAVPFEITPVNVSEVLNYDFKYRKGILFERFPVTEDSFHCSDSSPVKDTCTELACSHHCGYDYTNQKFVCTCPSNLTLDESRTNCSDTSDTLSTTLQTFMSIMPRDTTSTHPTVIPNNMSTTLRTIILNDMSTTHQSIIPNNMSTTLPTIIPNNMSTTLPTIIPDNMSTTLPTIIPNNISTTLPTIIPDSIATTLPTIIPDSIATTLPTIIPKDLSTTLPTIIPGNMSTTLPTIIPNDLSTTLPTIIPNDLSTTLPTIIPGNMNDISTTLPTIIPNDISTTLPTIIPNDISTTLPTIIPNDLSTILPTIIPNDLSTTLPTIIPNDLSTTLPTIIPNDISTTLPTIIPNDISTTLPTIILNDLSTTLPTIIPNDISTTLPTIIPDSMSTTLPTIIPDSMSTTLPTIIPNNISTTLPTIIPNNMSTTLPSNIPNMSITLPTNKPINIPIYSTMSSKIEAETKSWTEENGSTESEREASTILPTMTDEDDGLILQVMLNDADTRESDEKKSRKSQIPRTNILLPVFIDSLPPQHHHSKTNDISTHLKGLEMEDLMRDGVRAKMFLFDCVAAYNAEDGRRDSKTVLQCKILDKENGENIFIVIDSNDLTEAANP